ncbi:InlB B-repeat-containing protein [Candidatus Xianfuyuplasma coldseepsis]|uniref:InlB B-repeat-containing protein n=1 Tax=Candidatus Xianfuyuplasma coldseepsis TaxID=2782163 RepID=A0A7L7KSF5_9MOLU|nr:InlB B-repeat-containing protein [Xianfuyuplasma coldseepsis]QMS85146.1 hypothetical protein G4Z02_05100 [Xianfuyuplasma coldseepsis]
MFKRISLLSITMLLVLFLSSCFLLNPEGGEEEDTTLIVYFDTLGGNVVQPMEISKTDISLTLPTPVKEGYTFLGWSLTEDDDSLFNLNFTTISSSSITLYAVWEGESHTITIHPENGEASYDVMFQTGDSIVEIPLPTYTDHLFIDWYTDEALTVPLELAVMPNYDFDIYARWASDIHYTEDNVIWANIASMDTETLVVDIIIDGAVRFVGYEMEIGYDHTKLDLTSYTNGLENVVNDAVDGILTFNYVDAINPIEDTTVIITLTFDILNNDAIDLTISVDEFIDVTEQYTIVDTDYDIIPFTTE